MPERQPDPADPEQAGAPLGGAHPTGYRVLLLNATFEPLAVVTAKRAVVLMLTGKAECVQAALEGAFHSESLTIAAPSVMRLSRYVRVPYRRPVPMTRAGVLRRDGRRCAYCTRRADTIDHVVPRSRGGGHTWENCVAAGAGTTAQQRRHSSPTCVHRRGCGARHGRWCRPGGRSRRSGDRRGAGRRARHRDGGPVRHPDVAGEAHHGRRGDREVLGVERLEGGLHAFGLAGEHEDDGALGRDDGERLEGRVEQEDPGSRRERATRRGSACRGPPGRVVARFTRPPPSLGSDHSGPGYASVILRRKRRLSDGVERGATSATRSSASSQPTERRRKPGATASPQRCRRSAVVRTPPKLVADAA